MPDINIKLVKSESITEDTSIPDISDAENPASDIIAANSLGKVASLIKTAALAKLAYDLAKKSYERLRDIELDNRQTQEILRHRGGEGFSVNTFGDRFDIFGRRFGGESVAYRK